MDIQPIGIVHSSLKRRRDCPKQDCADAPEAWIEIAEEFIDGLDNIRSGNPIIILTWLHHAQRDVLKVHPRNNPDNPLRGVFTTRSPDRPNPIGLHCVKVLDINDGKIHVLSLEVIDGTPVLDIKPIRSNYPDY